MVLSRLFDGKGGQYQLDGGNTGDLSQLTTDAKGSLVEAVNEVDGRVPRVTTGQNGCFIRVVDGQLAAAELTDVSKEAV